MSNTKVKKVTKSEKVVEGTPIQDIMPAADIESFKSLIEQSMPEFVAKIHSKEDTANAIFAAAQEFFLVIEDALIRHHHFSPEEIKNLQEEIKPVLAGVAEYEKHGLSMLSPDTIDIVAEIADTRLFKERMGRVELEAPVTKGALPFLVKMQEKNKGRA